MSVSTLPPISPLAAHRSRVKFKTVLIDRDGILNVEPLSYTTNLDPRSSSPAFKASGYAYPYYPKDWEWKPGAIRFLQALRRSGFRIALLHNLGYNPHPSSALNTYINRELSVHNARPDTILSYNPTLHGLRKSYPSGDFIRESLPWLIKPNESWLICDRLPLLATAERLWMNSALLFSRHWTKASLEDACCDTIHPLPRPTLISDLCLELAAEIA